jgi:hypothetical protein
MTSPTGSWSAPVAVPDRWDRRPAGPAAPDRRDAGPTRQLNRGGPLVRMQGRCRAGFPGAKAAQVQRNWQLGDLPRAGGATPLGSGVRRGWTFPHTAWPESPIRNRICPRKRVRNGPVSWANRSLAVSLGLHGCSGPCARQYLAEDGALLSPNGGHPVSGIHPAHLLQLQGVNTWQRPSARQASYVVFRPGREPVAGYPARGEQSWQHLNRWDTRW